MSHRSIIQWEQWLSQKLGQLVLQKEQEILAAWLAGIYGKHAILVGVPEQRVLLKSLEPPYHLLLTPLHSRYHDINVIESHLHELPIASGSVDVVVLSHTLELVDNPRQVLTEACRIVKPEGHLMICGFNPYSLWGLKRVFMRKETIFPMRSFLNNGTIKRWLNLSDFELIKEATTLYSPPIENPAILKKLHFFEWLGERCHLPWGAVYVLMARAKVIPLTPIRWRWQQKLARVGIPNSIPGPTIRNSK